LVKILKGESKVLKIETLKKEFGFFKVFDLENESFNILLNVLKNKPIFQDEIVLFVKNFDSLNKNQKKELIEILDSIKDLEGFKVFIDSENKLGNFDVIDLSLPQPWKLEKWLGLIEKMAEKKSLKLDEEALKLIFERTGPNYDRIHREIEKLSLYSMDEKAGKVDIDTVENVIHDYNNVILDDLMFAISSGNLEGISDLFDDTFEVIDLQLLLYSLADHFTTLFKILCSVEYKERYSWKDIVETSRELSISSAKVARFLGFNFKNQMYKNTNHVELYDLEKLTNILGKIIDIQYEFRSTESSKTVLKNRLIEISRIVYN